MPVVKVAQAQEIEVEGCELYREAVQKQWGELTDIGLFIAKQESGCQQIRSHKQNSNGTWDYCIFQNNNDPESLENLDHCIHIAWAKYKAGRYGSMNASAWYAVCEKENTKKNPLPYPVPKYQNIKCK